MIIMTWVTVGSLSVIVELLGERFLSPTVSPTKSIYFERFLCFLNYVGIAPFFKTAGAE